MPDNLKAAKKLLRDRIIAQREALSPESRHAGSATILRSLLALPDYRAASAVAAFASFGSEINTWDFLRDALEAGKQLLLPRIDKSRRRLDLYRVRDLDSDLTAGVWGIREPATHCAPVDTTLVDFILVPGVAFTSRGERLGYGGGYYDRLLTELEADVPRVAAAFAMQIVEKLPLAEHDQRVHTVVTERQTLAA